jgi:RNA polymerase sigma-70 factor (ECF subfamily)
MISEEEKLPRQLQDWHDDPENLYTKEEMRQIVEKAIQSLPPIYREAFVLRDVEGLSTEEAAETLGLGVSALKTRLLRARLMMREVLAARFQRPPTLRSRIRRAGWMIRRALGTHSGRQEGK